MNYVVALLVVGAVCIFAYLYFNLEQEKSKVGLTIWYNQAMERFELWHGDVRPANKELSMPFAAYDVGRTKELYAVFGALFYTAFATGYYTPLSLDEINGRL